MFNFDNPFILLLNFFAHLFSGDFGYAIIAITVIIRFLLLPLFIKQEKQQKETQEKMNAMKPELAVIQEKISNAMTNEEKMNYQIELFGLYKKHNINVHSMGVLPALLQAPVLMGFYGALTNADILQNHSFLWFELSSHDLILAIIVGFFYFLQFKLNQKVTPTNPDQPNPLGFLMYVFPLLMLIISFTLPAGIGLYWATGTLFMITYKLLQLLKKRSA